MKKLFAGLLLLSSAAALAAPAESGQAAAAAPERSVLVASHTSSNGESPLGPAAGRFAEPKMLPPTTVTFPALLGQYQRGGLPSRGRTMVAWGDYEPIFIFPLVGSTAGGGGTFFHTATMITNHRSVSQDVQLYWFPVGGGSANCTRPSVRFHMDPATWYYWPDLAAQVLNASGLGAVAVAAVDSNGNLDNNGVIDGFSRIWTLIPGGSGSVSQSFVSESLNFDQGIQNAYGLEQDSAFRTNVGIFNYDVVQRSFNIHVSGANGSGNAGITVDACNVVLGSAPAGSYGPMAVFISAVDGRGLWYGFASSVDNLSGASWSAVAHP